PKIMLKFGYNLLILPADQSVTDYHVGGGADTYMPEAAVKTLSESGIMTVQHLLPIVQRKQVLVAGDRRLEVHLVGCRGEVPLAHRDPMKPLLSTVPAGGMIVGQEVARELGVKPGDSVRTLEADFQVIKVYEARGNQDDFSAWIELAQAQKLLGVEGKITGILALSCVCTRAQLDEIKKDIARILPGTRVHTMVNDAVIRYESRFQAAQEAEARKTLARRQGDRDIERQRESRAQLKGEIQSLTGWIVPLILVGSALAIALLALSNVRERRREIGVLRALGLRSRQVFAVFLTRAVLTGVVGACAGYLAGFAAAAAWARSPALSEIFDPALPAIALPAAALLAALASWAPATLAARQDPAVVLREE
ncbi:MAG TPA: FtsX-like permease family protein, partial [Phycisphaerae bacterium]|nr:FtsX-like permease family protein [Phycisphaerae bacterium]